MRLRPSMILSLACLALFAVACSGSTVVERANRPAGVQDAGAADNGAADNGATDSGATDSDAADSAEASETDADSDEAESAGSDSERPTVVPLKDPEASEGFGLGGLEQLTGLADDCETGNDQACDILFVLAAFDSAEEALAQDCGGRGEPEGGFCTEDITAFEDTLSFDEDSAALPGLAEDCEAGDLTTCDFLFFRSPVGSPYQELGNSCGGRIQAAAPDCRLALADE